jgi:archaellum component FlaC
MVVVYTEHVGKPEGWVHDYEGLFDNSSTVRYVVWACDTGFDLEDVIYRTDGRIKVILSEPNFNLGPEDVLHYFWYVSHYGGMFEIIDGVEGLDYTFDVTDLGAIYACRAILDGVILHEYIYRPDPMAIVGMILESVDAISEGIKELYGQIEAQAEGISAIWGEIEGIGGEIGELGEILEGLEGEIGELAEAIETILELLSNIGEVDLTEIGEAIGEIVAAIAEIGGEMDGIGVTIKTIDEKIAAIIAANEAQDESIEKLEQTVAELREKILELEAANAAMWEAINSIEVPEIPPYPEWPPYVPEEGGESGGNYDRVGSIFVYAGVGVFGVVFCFFIWLGMMVAVRAVRR